MKRALTILLVLALALGLCPTALGQEEAAAIPKMTPLGERVTAYTGFLEESFEDGNVITHVGLVDVNRDKYPEVFYVVKEDGESYAHFAYYEDETVEEYDVDFAELGSSPKSISLVRRRKVNTSEHCWVLQLQSKDEDKWNQRLFYAFQRAGTSLEGELKFQRRWKGSKKMYYVDEEQTLKKIYENEVAEFNALWPEANMDVNIKSRGAVTKVSNAKKWTSVRKALSTSLSKWNKL